MPNIQVTGMLYFALVLTIQSSRIFPTAYVRKTQSNDIIVNLQNEKTRNNPKSGHNFPFFFLTSVREFISGGDLSEFCSTPFGNLCDFRCKKLGSDEGIHVLLGTRGVILTYKLVN